MHFPYILPSANASDTKLVNRFKMSVFAKFYRKRSDEWEILYYAQLDHTTNEHRELQ